MLAEGTIKNPGVPNDSLLMGQNRIDKMQCVDPDHFAGTGNLLKRWKIRIFSEVEGYSIETQDLSQISLWK